MKSDVRILIIDDHPAMAFGTKMILESLPEVEVIGIAGDGAKGVALAAQQRPDIVFLDFNLPDKPGTDIAAELRRIVPEMHIVVFSGFDLTPMYNKMLKLEVSAIVSKDSSAEQLKNVIRCLLAGQTAIPLQLFRRMALSSAEHARSPLTEEEDSIMTLILRGMTGEQIAEEIHMSKRSVDNYLRKIYDKLGVNSRAQAIEKFIESRRA